MVHSYIWFSHCSHQSFDSIINWNRNWYSAGRNLVLRADQCCKIILTLQLQRSFTETYHRSKIVEVERVVRRSSGPTGLLWAGPTKADLFRTLSNRVYYFQSQDRDFPASLGNLLQCLIAITIKIIIKWCLNRICWCQWLFVLSLETTEESASIFLSRYIST